MGIEQVIWGGLKPLKSSVSQMAMVFFSTTSGERPSATVRPTSLAYAVIRIQTSVRSELLISMWPSLNELESTLRAVFCSALRLQMALLLTNLFPLRLRMPALNITCARANLVTLFHYTASDLAVPSPLPFRAQNFRI